MPTGREIMERAGILLNDEAYDRWTLPELAQWINAGVKAIVLAKPSAKSESRAISLARGTLQAVPTTPEPTPLRLLGIVCNLTDDDPRVRGRMVRPADRAQLDAAEPNWHNERFVPFRTEVRQFTFDEAVPLEFYVYPGNDGNGIVEAQLSVLPAALAASAAVDALASYEGDVGLPEPYSEPLLDYVLYRAQSKDSTDGGQGRGNDHYMKFATALGIKAQTDTASSPNRR